MKSIKLKIILLLKFVKENKISKRLNKNISFLDIILYFYWCTCKIASESFSFATSAIVEKLLKTKQNKSIITKFLY